MSYKLSSSSSTLEDHLIEKQDENSLNKHIGARVKLRRRMMGWSQEKLACAVGITSQQVQKYEKGANRMGASRLYYLSHALGTPVSFFYDSYVSAYTAPGELLENSFEENAQALYDHQLLDEKEILKLLRAFNKVSDSTLRRRILDLIVTLAETSSLELNEASDVR